MLNLRFKTLFYCGLRNGEMRGLRWNRIDWQKKQLKILQQVPTRYGSKEFKETKLKTKPSKRTIPIADTLYYELTELYAKTKAKYKNFTDDWFVFGDLLPISAKGPHQYQERICKKINLKIIRLHDFRHSCASFLINNGADIITVAKFLGHSKIDETLNNYGHMYKDKLNDIVNLTNRLTQKSSESQPNQIINQIACSENSENLEKTLEAILEVIKNGKMIGDSKQKFEK
jgi:integrase